MNFVQSALNADSDVRTKACQPQPPNSLFQVARQAQGKDGFLGFRRHTALSCLLDVVDIVDLFKLKTNTPDKLSQKLCLQSRMNAHSKGLRISRSVCPFT